MQLGRALCLPNRLEAGSRRGELGARATHFDRTSWRSVVEPARQCQLFVPEKGRERERAALLRRNLFNFLITDRPARGRGYHQVSEAT